jgi:type II secretory ATPase GspE/PulE/Tfp pilus assembly ATPase PilB-like protein
MAQRLVRRLCKECAEEYEPSDQELYVVGLDKKRLNGSKLTKSGGCRKCRNTGYKGRTAIFEIIPMSREIRKLIFNNANEDDIRTKALEDGMISLRESGLRKVLDGTTSIQEILRSTVEEF